MSESMTTVRHRRQLKVVVCGGRDFTDESRIWNGLEYFEETEGKIVSLAHGGAGGADSLAGEWARMNRVPCCVFRARWKLEGKKAGPLRNQRMLDHFKPDCVVAFDGGRGTADMVRRAEAEGVKVVRL